MSFDEIIGECFVRPQCFNVISGEGVIGRQENSIWSITVQVDAAVVQ